MIPGDPTEQLPRTPGAATGASSPPASTPNGQGQSPAAAPRIPLRPEDVDKARAEARTAKASGAAGVAGVAGGVVAAAKAAAARATAPKPAQAPGRPAGKPAAKAPAGRRVQLTVSRIDPWSALKMSFLLSVALGIALVVATAALWVILAGMGAFDQVNNLVGQIIQDGDKKFDIMDFVGFGRVVSLSIVFAVIDVFLWTAIATLGAFIYNVSSSLVGGLHLTLTDD